MTFDTDTPEPELVEAHKRHAQALQRQNAAFILRHQANHARFKTCQYIAGEPSADDACKCGAPTDEGGVYCARHRARCTYQPQPSQPAAIPEAA